MNAPHRDVYDGVARSIHWLVAVLVLGLLASGWWMVDVESGPPRIKAFNLHKSLGVLVLALMIVRTLWRLTHRPPPLPPMPAFQETAAHVVHGLLYLLLVLQPFVGWAYSNATGFPLVWFGAIPLPNIALKEPGTAEALEHIHVFLALLLALLVILHVAAALKHKFVDRDRTFQRMPTSSSETATNRRA